MSLYSELKKAFKPEADKYDLTIYGKNNYGMCITNPSQVFRRLDIDWYPAGNLYLSYIDREVGDFVMSDFIDVGGTRNIMYNGDSEFKNAVSLLVDTFDTRMMPYIKYIAPLVVSSTHDIYQALSINTIERAESFMSRNELLAEHKPENYRYIENLLVRTRGNDRLLQKARFSEQIEMILDTAAYLGEIKRRRHKPAQWAWEESPEYTDDYGERRKDSYYDVLCDNNKNFDPLCEVIGVWNHFPEITRFSLESYRKDYERDELPGIQSSL